MKKLLTILLVLFSFTAMAQPCADEDTVRSNAVSLITATTVRVNGSISHFTSGYTTLYMIYVRVGQTDTATTSGVSPLRNLTGLQPNTQYYYYYKTICVSGTNRQIGPYYFTTAVNTIAYATERSTVFPYVKTDSGFKVPRADTSLYRAPGTSGGDIMFKTSDSTMYYYNGVRWTPMAVDSGGYLALLNNKVDSVTVDSVTNRLYEWKQGVSRGYALPLDSAYVDGLAVNDSTLRFYRLDGDSSDFILRGTAGGATGTVTSVATTANTGLLGGTITTSGTLYIDTLLISTRAWRQKGIDSVAALITGGSGSVTSVATNNGSGITGGTITTTGTLAIDTVNVISTKWYRQKAVDSLLTLIGANPTGSGTTDYLARWTNSSTLGIGATRDDGTNVGIGVAPGTYKLNVNGDANISGVYRIAGSRVVFLPDQANFTGTVVYGNGGTALTHSAGLEGQYNLFVGLNTGASATTASTNVLVGNQVGYNLTSGYQNTGMGHNTLFNCGSCYYNTALGYNSMGNATGAFFNAAVGASSLLGLGNGYFNAAHGVNALHEVSAGFGNSGFGTDAGYYTQANNGVFVGYKSGQNLVPGDKNISIGWRTMAVPWNVANSLNIGNGILGKNFNVTGDSTISDASVGIGIPYDSVLAVLGLSASTTSRASLRIFQGTAPTTPNSGDIWGASNHLYTSLNGVTYQLDQQAGTNLGNSNLTQTGGNRTFTGAGQNLTFNGSGGTSLFNVEYNSIILTSLNSNILMQGDSIILDAESHLIHVDSLLQSVAPTNKMVVWDSVGKKLATRLNPAPFQTTNTTDVGNITTGVDDLMTYSVPAGLLATDGDYVEFTMSFTFAANANSKQVQVLYGATTVYATGAAAQNAGTMQITGTIIRTGATTQRITFNQVNNTALFSDYSDYTTAGETLSGAVTLKATGEGVSTDDIIQKILIVKKYIQ